MESLPPWTPVSPFRIRSRVVLPAPFGPESETRSRALDLERDPVEERIAGELLAEVGCGDDGHGPKGRARRLCSSSFRRGRYERQGPVNPGVTVPPKVLVCDNEEALRALVRGALDLTDYEIVEARDGDESVDLARFCDPDLIVLDMMMPGRTGLEVLAELRTEPRFSEIPVIMLTARAQVEDRQAALEAGVSRFLPKPFSPLELASVVEELLNGNR